MAYIMARLDGQLLGGKLFRLLKRAAGRLHLAALARRAHHGRRAACVGEFALEPADATRVSLTSDDD
uniref:Uncharacterized protein n=1 Tax=Oryza brachyantha TaxID=4533 RepID=J3LN32_ORYBR